MKFRTILLATAALLLLAAAPADVPAQGLNPPASRDAGRDMSEEQAVQLFVRALREVRERYVDRMSERELAEIAVQAMVGRDRWSKYMDEGQYRDIQADNQGSLVGIGIRFEVKENAARVTETFLGSPAAEAGLRAGDLIQDIDGRTLAGLTVDQVRALIRGEEGSAVRVTVATPDGARREVSLRRRAVTVPSVAHTTVDGIGYVRIGKFDQQTVPGFEAALKGFRRGPALAGIVLDLRDCPGGLVDASVEIADALLEGGKIITTEGRDRRADDTVSARPGDDTGGLPVVVLVNGRTASAAEILAGALQDNHRAVLVGTKTFGKGVIQSTRPLPGGGAIRLTTARYITPSGRKVHEVGIMPDFQLGSAESTPVPWGARPDPAEDVQLAQAMTLLGQGTRPAMPRTTTAGMAQGAPAEGGNAEAGR